MVRGASGSAIQQRYDPCGYSIAACGAGWQRQ